MPDHIYFGGVFFLGVASGFALAAVLGVFQLRRRHRRDRLEIDKRVK